MTYSGLYQNLSQRPPLALAWNNSLQGYDVVEDNEQHRARRKVALVTHTGALLGRIRYIRRESTQNGNDFHLAVRTASGANPPLWLTPNGRVYAILIHPPERIPETFGVNDLYCWDGSLKNLETLPILIPIVKSAVGKGQKPLERPVTLDNILKIVGISKGDIDLRGAALGTRRDDAVTLDLLIPSAYV